eukprot:237674_1
MSILTHDTHYVSLYLLLSISYFVFVTSNSVEEDDLSDYTLYYHQYEFDWDKADDWMADDEYTQANLPHACTHRLEVLDHKLCVIGKSLGQSSKDIQNPSRVPNGHPVNDKNGGFVINFKKKNGKERFKLHHINTKDMDHIFYNKAHPHIMTKEELQDAIRNGKLNTMGNTFSVTYHGLVFDFVKNADWRKIGSHHSPRYMDNTHIRPKLVQNNDPAPQIQDQLDQMWEELDHYNNFVKEMSYSRKRYKGPKLVIPPGTQNAAWPSDPHHALNLFIPNKRPRGAPKIKDLPGQWNKMWGRTPEADYLDYGTVFPRNENANLLHRMRGEQDFTQHPARNKKELGEPEHPLFQAGEKPKNTNQNTNKKDTTKTKKEAFNGDKTGSPFGNVPTKKDKDGNVYVRPGMTNMNDRVDADGKTDKDYKDPYKEHNIGDSGHFRGMSNPMMMNVMMQNPGLRMMTMGGMNGGRGMGLHHLANMYSRMYGMNPRMMQMMYMLGSPYVQQALPYMSMGYTPNLFGHGMPIYHGTRFDNEPLSHHPAMAHQSFENVYDTSEGGGYHGGMYQNGDKGPLHSPWRVKMRRCRLKNGQRVIFPASQVNMDKFHQICDYDPDAPNAQYSIDIDVPPAARFNQGGGTLHPFHYGGGAHAHPMAMPRVHPASAMMPMMNPMMGGMMNPMMMGGGMMHPGMMGGMMHPGMMGGMMHPGMMGGMMHPGMGGRTQVHHHYPSNGVDHHFYGEGQPDINIYANPPKKTSKSKEATPPPTLLPTRPPVTTTTSAPKPAPSSGPKPAPSGMSGYGMGMNPMMMGGMNSMMNPMMMGGMNSMMNPMMMGGMGMGGMYNPMMMGG